MLASIYWPDWITQGDKVKSALEGSYSVPEALERAETLCSLQAFNRIVISIQDCEVSQEERGKLLDEEGCD